MQQLMVVAVELIIYVVTIAHLLVYTMSAANSGNTILGFKDKEFNADGDLTSFVFDDEVVAYMRMSFIADTEEAIITVNEEIVDGASAPYANLAKTVTEGQRLNSSGTLTAASGATTVEDYIQYEIGDVIRVKGLDVTKFNTALYSTKEGRNSECCCCGIYYYYFPNGKLLWLL